MTALLGATTALGAAANYKGVSADGEVVFFETVEQLVPGDTDNKSDVYERFFDADPGIETRITREVSLGPAGGNDAYTANFEKASASGTRVFFSTEESLVAADKDRRLDVYMRDLDAGTTTLVSRGEADCAPACGNAAKDAGFAGADTDGTRAFFVTDERLSAGDTDNSVDVYERDLISPETTNLVSSGGNGAFDASLRGLSPDGSWAYFTTPESLSSADTDSAVDIYAHDVSTGTTTLASRGEPACSPCGNGPKVPVFRGSSEDGTRLFFTSDEPLVPADSDTATDIYVRDLPAGPTAQVSGGSSSTLTASFAAASADGAHVFFTTAESLVGSDADTANDVYEWSNGTIELVTSAACTSSCGATFDAASADSETVVFSTAEQLSGEDSDSRVDIYEQEVGGGAPLLVSRAATGCVACTDADARFNRASSDAARVVFTTIASLSDEDDDIEDDIYARDTVAGETSLITTSPSFCPLKKGSCGATFVDTSGDGRHVFFTTVERFTLEDGDNEVDIYERFLGDSPGENLTRLVSTGNSPDLDLGPPAPDLEGTTPESPNLATNPLVFGQAEEETGIKLYTTSNCSGEPVATGTAAELEDPGIAVTAPAGETTSFRATAEAEGFVSFCSQPIEYQAEGGASEDEGGEGSDAGSGGRGAAVGVPTGSGIFYLAPHTRITFAPAGKTRLRHPVFRFTDSTGQPGTRFECKLDRRDWKRCSSPLRLKKVSLGRHVLSVKAVNAAGAEETSPARRAFRLVKG